MEASNPSVLPFSSELFAFRLQKSLRTRDISGGKLIHSLIIKSGLHLGVFLMNSLMNFYAKTGSVSDAHQLFDEMPVRTNLSWNTILSAYAKQGRFDLALRIFNEMPDRDSVSWTAMIVGYNKMGCFNNAIGMFVKMISDNVPITQFMITNVLASCAAIGALDVGRKVHSFVVKHGLSSYVSVANSLLNMYAKSGDPIMAKRVFERMRLRDISSWNTMISLHMQYGRFDLALSQFEQMTERDIVSWNTIIAGYNQRGFDMEALVIFSDMLKDSSLKPDKFTLASVLSACGNLEKLELGRQIHAQIVRNASDASVSFGNALISMYAKSGGVEIARKILLHSGSSHLNVIAFTALLDGYIKLGDKTIPQFFSLFHFLQNNYTLAAMLSVSSSLASLDYGKQIHASAMRSGEVLSASVSNALITMYAKGGSISCAKQVYNLMQQKRDPVSWTSMIIALAQHGLGEEAIELFESMLTLGVKPDHITFVGVLPASTHVGWVEQGRKYYNLMRNVHKIEPTLSHYACMIDLFGRAGLLQEAFDFIKSMRIEPDVIAWGSLLSSCKVHKNEDMAKVAAERLLIIDPGNSGLYSALANLYSACGKWEDAARIRKSMKDKGVKKDQGFSWKDAIYKMMEKIWKEIKKMGFIPNTESVLHDLDEELKEQILKHHKYYTKDLKNLRVCNDCHSSIKFISKLVGREIIVRDATRFHHFKNGMCSCRDYW
ncbi:hypothetical protein UlMin_038144 [Ulmus minor]